MNYKLNEQNGEVEYLMMAGNDIVRHKTNINAARWACEHYAPKSELLAKDMPEYCVHSGEFYFSGKWTKKRRVKDEVCE